MFARLFPKAAFGSFQRSVSANALALGRRQGLPSSGLRPPGIFNSQRSYARRRYEYKRFGQQEDSSRFSHVRRYWISSPGFRLGVVGVATGGVVFYFANIQTVPATGRRRFNFISPEWMAKQGIQEYQETMRQYRGRILPDSAPETRLAKKVLERLVPASGIPGEWELHVVQDSEANAFVLPGNKVFVFTGILPICENEAGLATVLGHEIAHNVAQHAAERTSQLAIVVLASEADHIGLLMMAESCFDPAESLSFWKRMDKAQKFKPPQFLSTHPSEHNRFKKLQEWLPQAQDRRSQGDCGFSTDYVNPFKGFQDQVKQEMFLE